MNNQVMSDDEESTFIKEGGEFGLLVAKLTRRAIESETLAESLQTTVHLQEAQVLSLQRRLTNAEIQRDDALRDVGRMNDAMTKMGAILRESHAQRVSAPAVRQQDLTGAPQMPARDLRVVRETAIANAQREAAG